MCISVKVSDPLELELDRCEEPSGCWGLKLDPLQELAQR